MHVHPYLFVAMPLPTLTYNWTNNVITNNAMILNIIHNIFNFRDRYNISFVNE